ncbi:MAG TPA: lysophospholipid acyltransferase family protein [Albitalea sp.]|nr:lysophospholipid acyltransferase family protein [Albitalea sp.]
MRHLLWSLRSALFTLWMTVTVIPWAVLSLVASLFMRGTPLYRLTTFWLRFAIGGARTICGVHWRISGAENLAAADRDGPIIILPKHQSTWETFAFPLLMPHPLCYVFKRELLMIPFFGWAMARLDMIHIDRNRRAEAWNKVAEQGRRLLAQGNWIIMFPEGTRTARGSQGTYKHGGARLAVTTGAAVLPIAVTSARCWPRKSFMLRPGVIDVSIGRAIASAGRQPDELMREVEAWIEAEMRRLDPEAYAAEAPRP